MSSIPRVLAGIQQKLIDKGLMRGNQGYQKFIILGRARVGSNLLNSYLNSHPNVVSREELFNPSLILRHSKIIKDNPVGYVESKAFKPMHSGIIAAGFKIFYDQAQDTATRTIWSFLKELKGLKIVHIKRDNLLRTYLSEKIAQKTGVWHLPKRVEPLEKDKTVVLNLENCISFFSKRKYNSTCKNKPSC